MYSACHGYLGAGDSDVGLACDIYRAAFNLSQQDATCVEVENGCGAMAAVLAFCSNNSCASQLLSTYSRGLRGNAKLLDKMAGTYLAWAAETNPSVIGGQGDLAIKGGLARGNAGLSRALGRGLGIFGTVITIGDVWNQETAAGKEKGRSELEMGVRIFARSIVNLGGSYVGSAGGAAAGTFVAGGPGLGTTVGFYGGGVVLGNWADQQFINAFGK